MSEFFIFILELCYVFLEINYQAIRICSNMHLYLKDVDTGAGSLYLKISEIWNGGKSSVYVEKSALKTFISSIEMVAKQKERVTFPNRNVMSKRNMIMEYLGDRHMS